MVGETTGWSEDRLSGRSRCPDMDTRIWAGLASRWAGAQAVDRPASRSCPRRSPRCPRGPQRQTTL